MTGLARNEQERMISTSDPSEETWAVHCSMREGATHPSPKLILAPFPKQASTTTSVSSDCAGVLAAIDSGLNEADQVTQLSSGFTVPIEAERVLKPAAASWNCSAKYFDDDEKEGLDFLTAMPRKFSIPTRANELSSVLAEVLRGRVARGINTPGEELGMWLVNSTS